VYQGLPKISENFNIPRKPLALRTWAATCLFLYLSTNSLANWLLCKCTCLWVSAVFFTPLSRVFALIEMAGVMEQRICITFCFKLNKTAPETHRKLKEAFGEQALSQARTFEWFKRSKDGRESVQDDKHSGRPSTCTTQEMIADVLEVILKDRRQTIHDVCNSVGLSYGSCQHILADELSMRRIAAKFVTRLLKTEQWDHGVQVCTELQKAVRHDLNFLSRVITGDVRPSPPAISMCSLK